MLPDEVGRRIDTAAALLTAAGHADSDPAESLHCLLAVDHLLVAGADPTGWAAMNADAVQPAIREALAHLGALPREAFARPHIVAAAAAAQTALERAEDA